MCECSPKSIDIKKVTVSIYNTKSTCLNLEFLCPTYFTYSEDVGLNAWGPSKAFYMLFQKDTLLGRIYVFPLDSIGLDKVYNVKNAEEVKSDQIKDFTYLPNIKLYSYERIDNEGTIMCYLSGYDQECKVEDLHIFYKQQQPFKDYYTGVKLNYKYKNRNKYPALDLKKMADQMKVVYCDLK
jgi:hypothetical protein